MKSLDNGTVTHDSHDLLGTVDEFSLLYSYTDVPTLLRKYKECSCALPTFNITEEIWCEMILKH